MGTAATRDEECLCKTPSEISQGSGSRGYQTITHHDDTRRNQAATQHDVWESVRNSEEGHARAGQCDAERG